MCSNRRPSNQWLELSRSLTRLRRLFGRVKMGGRNWVEEWGNDGEEFFDWKATDQTDNLSA